MTSVTQAVQDIISQNLFLQEAINIGIVSYNKLAEYIRPDVDETIGAKTKISIFLAFGLPFKSLIFLSPKMI